jgi:glucose/arabinose dehydrogenase
MSRYTRIGRQAAAAMVLVLASCAQATPVVTPPIILASPSPAPVMDTPTPTAEESYPEPLSPEATLATGYPEPTPEPSATALPDPLINGSAYTWKLVAEGLQKPVDLTYAPDGSGRLFVIEQPGLIRIVQAGAVWEEPFLDIRDRININGSERGLLGLAFHPRYAANGFFFVNYTGSGGHTVIARFSVSAGNPNLADPESEVRLLQVKQPFANHNGGGLAFGPDGYLYIALGDGGSGGDPKGNGQSLQTHLGKILRINVDQDDAYSIPSDNPLVGSGRGLLEIWAYGLRNPWRFSFDRLTGDVYIGDVGQGKWEEINFIPAGTPGPFNFGWNLREGLHPYKEEAVYTGPDPLVDPVFEYDHGQGCSVTGGVVYRGQALPEWQGVYLFGDYCRGSVWAARFQQDPAPVVLVMQTGFSISSFGMDEAGEVYLLDHKGGIYRLERAE